MEEKMKDWGLVELCSSELQIIGGAEKEGVFTKIFDKIRNIVDFIADYIPKFFEGLKDGFLGKDISK